TPEKAFDGPGQGRRRETGSFETGAGPFRNGPEAGGGGRPFSWLRRVDCHQYHPFAGGITFRGLSRRGIVGSALAQKSGGCPEDPFPVYQGKGSPDRRGWHLHG